MQPPTPRPESLTPEPIDGAAHGGDAPEAEPRGVRRDARYAPSASSSLKLLERRTREAGAHRDVSRKAPVARPALPSRAAGAPLVHTSEARRRITILRRVQLGLAAAGIASLALLAIPLVPVAVPLVFICACLLGSVYLAQVLTRPLPALADTARAVVLGDHGARAATAAGDLSEIARALNSVLDERSALVAQTSEQQQRLQNDIHDLAVVVRRASAGELSARAKVHSGSLGKLADEINAAFDTFGELVRGVRTASATMLEALAQAQDLAQHLRENVSRQGSGLESSAEVVRHVAACTEAVNESAVLATEASRRTAEAAQEGGRLLHRLLEGSLDARRKTQSSATRTKRLCECAMEISTIVGAISRVSAQTNILGLNAAIAASRAGEHGLGFTLIADEVRRLAEDCEEATREIAPLIAAIQSEANDSVADLERQAGQVDLQTQLATDAGDALERILSASQQGAKLVSGISEAAHQQAVDTAGLRESMQNAGQTALELQAMAETAQGTIAALQAAAADLSRRAATFRPEATSGAGADSV